MVNIMQNLISVLVSGITGVATGIGQGVQTLITELMFVTDATTHTVTDLSTFGYTVVIFAGIGLAIGLSRKIYMLVSTLGGRK